MRATRAAAADAFYRQPAAAPRTVFFNRLAAVFGTRRQITALPPEPRRERELIQTDKDDQRFLREIHALLLRRCGSNRAARRVREIIQQLRDKFGFQIAHNKHKTAAMVRVWPGVERHFGIEHVLHAMQHYRLGLALQIDDGFETQQIFRTKRGQHLERGLQSQAVNRGVDHHRKSVNTLIVTIILRPGCCTR